MVKLMRQMIILIFIELVLYLPAEANVPYAPDSLVITRTPTEITLTWKTPATVPNGYRIYRDAEVLTEIPQTTQYYSYATPLPSEGGTYAYSVRAYNVDGESDRRICRIVTVDYPANTTNSIRQYGITITFGESHRWGRFANGDYWVLGPVTIVGITPACTTITETVDNVSIQRDINGAMLNPYVADHDRSHLPLELWPHNTHGYDGGPRYYDANLNAAKGISANTPLNIANNNSLVATAAWYPYNAYKGFIRTAMVLTVLESEPPAGSFRPSYASENKIVQFNTSDIDYSHLLNLPKPARTPYLPDIESRLQRAFVDHFAHDFTQEGNLIPFENMPGYGREVCFEMSTASLMLNLDYSPQEKEKLTIALIQMGIDLYGVATRGAGGKIWRGWGGHRTGRKFPILFAGVMLNNNEIKNVQANFAEDDLTYYYNDTHLPEEVQGRYSWTGSKVLYKFNYYWDDPKYNQIYEHKHPSQWTVDGDTVPYIVDNLAEDYRYCCTARSWVGFTLAVRLMNFMDVWNNPSFFDYMDRWMGENMAPYVIILNREAPKYNSNTGEPIPREARDYQNTMGTFIKQMWDTHRTMTDQESPTSPQKMFSETVGGGYKRFYWERAGDNVGGVWYKVFSGGNEIGLAYDTTYTDSSLVFLSADSVVAFDWIGNRSDECPCGFDDGSISPMSYSLSQNYPNPFNPKTNIHYSLGMNGPVSIKIFDILGREIITLLNKTEQAGEYSIEWNGRDSAGRQVGSGVYFYRLRAGGVLLNTKKMILIR